MLGWVTRFWKRTNLLAGPLPTTPSPPLSGVVSWLSVAVGVFVLTLLLFLLGYWIFLRAYR